ncbi:hypothetical protein G6011_09391 [Alternaria panax]|uniref:RBR-type E3 ubiquitin transferase n=1 Tax=Alternaria panax TaxID=48097 RepID=A0AAD4NNZ3_9PLEO|nr:hypothetical protein G6011_09391 [Alternaria panax]
MGSKFSRAVRPQVKAAASPVATAQHHDIDHANARRPRQEITPQLPDPFSYDDINVAASITKPAILQRRNSAPATSFTMSTASAAMDYIRDNTGEFGLFLAQHRLMAIQYAGTDPDPASVVAMTPPTPVPAQSVPVQELPFQQPEVRCIICCNELPDTKHPKHAKEVIKPCRDCGSTYCGSCIRKMFTECCKDTTRMPPRCCVQIQPHFAKPHLTGEEYAEFKSKYEEWLTPNPFYCPVPTCSAFIPERLVPEQARKKKGKRVDSGVGTPTSKAIACPTCDVGICLNCRQIAHPNNLCNVSEFGIDAETTELLKSWGYKKCPKCGHGLKRMFGCNHMECRCGAHFCYGCMEDYNNCRGACSEEDNYDDGGDDDEEPEEQDETELLPAANIASAPSPEAFEQQVTAEEAASATPLPASPPRNLDGGGQRFWERQDLDFGEEPTEDYPDRSWDCAHDFEPYTTTLARALTSDPSTDMECVKCWRTIHPEIKAPDSSSSTEVKVKTVAAGARGAARGITRGMNRGCGRGRGGGQGRYVPPRGLYEADGAVGTAPHLRHTWPSPLSQSVPTREPSPMEDVQYFEDRVVDTYGNIIATSEMEIRRRASEASFVDDVVDLGRPGASAGQTIVNAFKISPAIFSDPAVEFSLAHECRSCALLVCASCRDGILTAQHAESQDY